MFFIYGQSTADSIIQFNTIHIVISIVVTIEELVDNNEDCTRVHLFCQA